MQSSPLASLPDLLGRPMDGVARLVLTQERHRSFRWLVIVEFFLFGLGCLILLPIVALAVVGGVDLGTMDLPDFKGRAHHYWQELSVEFFGVGGEKLAEIRGRPQDASEGHARIATVLGAARRHGLVVTHLLQPLKGPPELVGVHFGARELLASPSLRALDASAAVLQAAGAMPAIADDTVTLTVESPGLSRFVAWAILALIACPLLPLLVLFARGRRWLTDVFFDATGGPPRQRVLTVRAEAIELRTERGGKVRERRLIDGGDLLAFVYAPSYRFDTKVTRQEAALRAWTKTQSVELISLTHLGPGLGPALRDFIVAATLDLRAARPELGLSDGPRPIRCPFCAGTYELRPGVVCPHCGAPATAVV